MGKTISLFPTYTQKENRVTNYVLLLLRQVYKETPELFEELIISLLEDESKIDISISFKQQEKKLNGSTIPDGVISQPAFNVYIETKNTDWFHNQLLEHLKALEKEDGIKILFALAKFEDKNQNNIFKEVENKVININANNLNSKNKIFFKVIDFESLLINLNSLEVKSEYLIDMIKEFSEFLDYEGLLPTWKYKLDVVNCASSIDSVLKHNVYICPEAKGAYKHQKCKYFGIYKDKSVKKVAEIHAVIEVDDDANNIDSFEIKWTINENCDKNKITEIAKEKLNAIKPDYRPIQMFLLGEFKDCEFIKSSPGGLFGSKKYFEFPNVNTIEELILKLNQSEWKQPSSHTLFQYKQLL